MSTSSSKHPTLTFKIKKTDVPISYFHEVPTSSSSSFYPDVSRIDFVEVKPTHYIPYIYTDHGTYRLNLTSFVAKTTVQKLLESTTVISVTSTDLA